MSFLGDIALDENGNTMIENGDIAITTSNINFIVQSLKYGIGAWDLYPSVGFGVDRYVGEPLDDKLIDRIKSEIYNYFIKYGITIRTKIVKVDRHSIACRLNVLTDDDVLTFAFDLTSGIIVFSNVLTVEGIEETSERSVPTNKYLIRRR